MSEYYDTYFINSKRALKMARENNNVILNNGFGIQLCYYSGEKLESTPKNMLHLSIDNIKEFFSKESYRRPLYIDFIKSDFEDNEELQIEFTKSFLNIFKQLDKEDSQTNRILFDRVKNSKMLNLNPKKINFTIIVSKALKSNFYYAKQLKKSLISQGHTTTILTEKGSKNYLINYLKTKVILKKLLKIKPNVIIFINDYKPTMIPSNVYQVSIIKGYISALETIEKRNVREKDVILSQNQHINALFNQKDISSKYIQPVTSSTSKPYDVGSKSTLLTICSNFIDLDNFIVFEEMFPILFKQTNTKILTIKKLNQSIKNTAYKNKDDYELMSLLQKSIVIQSAISWLSPQKYKIKILGRNWEKYQEASSNIKIKETFNMKKNYAKSKYVLHVSTNIIDENLLEILDSNSIPIVYDLRDEDKNYNKKFDDHCLFFRNRKELNNILKKGLKPNKQNNNNLLQTYSYDKLAKQITRLIINN